MINRLPRYIIVFIVLVLAQILLFNNIQLSGYLNPYIYILFILVLPFETPKWGLLAAGFILGITIDLFSHTIGMHASATVFMAYLRPHILRNMEPRDGYEPDTEPSIQDYGFSWFLKYSAILTLAHHIFLFYIEVFKFEGFFQTLSRAVLSALMSILIIVLIKIFIRK
jgi:rod shape-determining protein MreD